MLCILFLTSCLTIMIVVGDSCEVIRVPMCKDLGYMTKLPNSLGHLSQEDAGLAIHQFFPMVKVQCSQDLREFLCAVYLPRCDPENPNGLVRTPTRQLCESSRTGCQPLMNKFGFSWPNYLKCDRFQDDITTTTKLPDTTTSYITTTTKLPDTTTSSVNRMIFPCTIETCQYKMNIKYSPTSITFASCCELYAYTKKTFSLPTHMNFWVRNADIRSSSVPVVTWKPVKKSKHQGNHGFFTLIMVTGSLDSEFIVTDWMVINMRYGYVSTGITVKEYSGPNPVWASFNKVYFLLYVHRNPVDDFSMGKYIQDRNRMDVNLLINDNSMILVSSTYMLVNKDEYSRYREVHLYGTSESKVCLNVTGYTEACRTKSGVLGFS